MNAGVTFAKAHNLTPGVALSAEQMAKLTSDIVWLVEQTVTLPNGTQQKVLVPQLYVRVKEGELSAGKRSFPAIGVVAGQHAPALVVNRTGIRDLGPKTDADVRRQVAVCSNRPT